MNDTIKKVNLAVQMFNFVAGGDWEKISSQEEVTALLAQLADAGYNGVEWCNFQLGGDYLDLPALRTQMDALGLKTCGMHFHYNNADTLDADCETAVKRCKILGCDKLIFAYSIPETFGIQPEEEGKYTPGQIDEWALQADFVLDSLAKAAQGTDIQILYHNHATELLKGTDGKPFLEKIHPAGQEYDVYWVAKGLDGKVASALSYIQDHREDVRLLHIKDGLDGSVHAGEMCGWGKGTYPIQKIIDFAKDQNLEWVVSENDAPNNFGTSGAQDALETATYVRGHINI